MSEDIQVKITGNSASATNAFKEVDRTVQASSASTQRNTVAVKNNAKAHEQQAKAVKQAAGAAKGSSMPWGELKKAVGDIGAASGGAVPGLNALSGAFGNILAGAGVIGTITGLTVAIAKLTQSSWEFSKQYGGAVNDIVDKTDMAGEAASKIVGVGQAVGLSAQEVGQALAIMSRNAVEAYGLIQQAGANGEASSDNFSKWGIAITDENGKLLRSAQILDNVRLKHREMANGVEKTAMEMELMGRSGTKMNDMLNLSDQTISEWTDKLKDAGLIMSTEASQAFEDIEQRGRLVDQCFDGLKLTIGTALIPVVDELNDFLLALNKDLRENGNWTRAAGRIADVAHIAFDMLKVSVGAVKQVFEGVSDAIQVACGWLEYWGELFKDFNERNNPDNDWETNKPPDYLKAVAVDTNEADNFKYGDIADTAIKRLQTGMTRAYKTETIKTNDFVDNMRAQMDKIPFKLAQLDPKKWSVSDTGCVYSISLALDSTPFAGMINTTQMIAKAEELKLLHKLGDGYTPKAGDTYIGDFGDGDPIGHAVMRTENGGTIQNGATRGTVYESSTSPENMAQSIAYVIETSAFSSGGNKGAGVLAKGLDRQATEAKKIYDALQKKVSDSTKKISDEVTKATMSDYEIATATYSKEVEDYKKLITEVGKTKVDTSELAKAFDMYKQLKDRQLDLLALNDKHTSIMNNSEWLVSTHQGNKTQESDLQLQELNSYKAMLMDKINATNISEKERLELRKTYLEAQTQAEILAAQKVSTAWVVVSDKLKERTFDYAALLEQTVENINSSINESMQNWIGSEESFGERITTLWKNVANSVINMIIQIALQQSVLTPLSNTLGNLFGRFGSGLSGGGFSFSGGMALTGGVNSIVGGVGSGTPLISVGGYAEGGYAPAGLKLVGEKGAELIDTKNPGRVYTNDQLRDALSGGGGANITMNISTPDANSFRQSRSQIASSLAAMVQRGQG